MQTAHCMAHPSHVVSSLLVLKLFMQGARPELLPERLLGTVRFSRLDLKAAIPLNPADFPDDDLNETFPSLVTNTKSAPGQVEASDFELEQTANSHQSLHSLRSNSVTSVQAARGGSLTGSQGHSGSLHGSSSLTDSGHLDMPPIVGQVLQQQVQQQQQPYSQQLHQQQPPRQQQQEWQGQGQSGQMGRSYSSALPARSSLTHRHSQALPTVAEPVPTQQAAPAMGNVAGSRQRAEQNGAFQRAQSLQSTRGGSMNSQSAGSYAQNGQAEDDMQRQYGRVKWSDKPSLAASSRK